MEPSLTLVEIKSLQVIEILFCGLAIGLGVLCIVRHTPGWLQVPIIMPWLIVKLIIAGLTLFGIILPNIAEIYLLMIAGPASITVLFAARLWNHGS